MRTIVVKIMNNGPRAQVLRTYGGTVTVRSKETLDAAEIYPLDEQQAAHYAARGVTVSPVKRGAQKAKDAVFAREALEDAYSKAQANLDAAKKGGDIDVVAAAQKEVDEAQRALAALEE